MRIHHRLTALTGFLATLVVGTSTFAQSMAPGPQGYPTAPGPYAGSQLPMVPPTFQPTFSSNDPSKIWPPGAPQNSYPFPDMSPHLGANVLQEQHYNRDGQWFNEIIHRHRQYYASAEAMTMYFDQPGDAWVGSKPARVRPDTMTFASGISTFVGGNRKFQPSGEGNAGNLSSNWPTVGPGAFPFPWIQIDDTTEQVLLIPGTTFFPIRKVGSDVFPDHPSSPGFKIRSGYINDDGTGIGVEGWYAFQNNDSFQVGQDKVNGIPITQSLIAGFDIGALGGIPASFDVGGIPTNGAIFINFLVGGLPLNENSGVIDTYYPGAGFTGTTQKYDLLYRLDIASEAGSAQANFYLGNLIKRKSFRAVAFASARYFYMNEYFRFRGVDSGFGYDITQMGGGGGGNNTGNTYRPSDTIFGPLYPLLDSRLQSFTTSNLGGPELGIRVDLGRSKRFNLWMQTSAGLLANVERLQVRGQNIGNAEHFRSQAPFGFAGPPPLGTGDASLDMFANDTRFNDIQHHTTVSPTFNFGLNAEMDVFPYLPIFKYVPVVNAAQLTLGYNFMYIGNISRPADSINWRGFPQFPSVRTDRENFMANQISAGIKFER